LLCFSSLHYTIYNNLFGYQERKKGAIILEMKDRGTLGV